jgi:hypothetical protein
VVRPKRSNLQNKVVIKTPADKLTIEHRINLSGEVLRGTARHNVRSVFAAFGDERFTGTQRARLQLCLDVKRAIRRAYPGSKTENEPNWPRIEWSDIKSVIRQAKAQYEPLQDRQAREELAEERYLATLPEPTDPSLLH